LLVCHNATNLALTLLQVNARQRGNPILKAIRACPWEFNEEITADYVLGQRACAVFLSVRYHTLNPEYIHERLKKLGKAYELRVLLVQVDVKEPHHALKQLMRICLLADLTLMLAWSAEEAGKMLETYRLMENKPPDMIMGKSSADVHGRLVESLCSVRSVNKTDAAALLATFGTFENIVKASVEELSLIPGFGPQKANKLHKVLREDFKRQTNSEPV